MHRRLFVRLADQISVDDAGVIRTFPHDAARRIGVMASALLGNAVMVDHGIHISGRYKKCKSWLPENGNAVLVLS